MDDLTKEQKHLLVSMYKEMLSRKHVLSLRESRHFENSDVIRDLFCLKCYTKVVTGVANKI